jgi:hypothetical protein
MCHPEEVVLVFIFQICRNINRIKVCMETGQTVILLNLENLYESLYDALNQVSHCLIVYPCYDGRLAVDASSSFCVCVFICYVQENLSRANL